MRLLWNFLFKCFNMNYFVYFLFQCLYMNYFVYLFLQLVKTTVNISLILLRCNHLRRTIFLRKVLKSWYSCFYWTKFQTADHFFVLGCEFCEFYSTFDSRAMIYLPQRLFINFCKKHKLSQWITELCIDSLITLNIY